MNGIYKKHRKNAIAIKFDPFVAASSSYFN